MLSLADNVLLISLHSSLVQRQETFAVCRIWNHNRNWIPDTYLVDTSRLLRHSSLYPLNVTYLRSIEYSLNFTSSVILKQFLPNSTVHTNRGGFNKEIWKIIEISWLDVMFCFKINFGSWNLNMLVSSLHSIIWL